jgi:hypothetical protein
MNEKEDMPSRFGSTVPRSHQDPRPSKLTVTKAAILLFILMILVFTYRPQCYTQYILNSDLVSQDNDSIPDLHNNNFFRNSHPSSKIHNRLGPQYIICDSTDSIMHYGGELNITDEFHLLDSSQLLPKQDMHGTISVKRGPSTQISDVKVDIAIQFSASSPIPDVRFGLEISKSTIQLDYMSTECIEVVAIIYLKPDSQKRLRELTLETEILDLNIQESLSWTVDNLSIHSSHGNTDFSGTTGYEPMITHNVSFSTISGEIFGDYVADAHLHLFSESGHMGGFIMPRYNSDAPIFPKSITATTSTGDIHLEMVGEWEDWPSQPFSHTTDIHSDAGYIWIALPHGCLTNVTNLTGDIAAIMIPFGTASKEDQSEMHTFSSEGDMYVHFYNTLQHTLKDGQFDPLMNTRSRHKVGRGNMRIRYPYSWYGDLEGAASKGQLEFDGSKLEDVERGEWWVKARRGHTGESFMESWVQEGDLDIKVGLGPW